MPKSKNPHLVPAANLGYNTAMAQIKDFGNALRERFGDAFSVNVPLAALSSFEIGGPADFFFEARTVEDLRDAMALAAREKLPSYVIGGGNNMLFDDQGFRGLVIRNRLEGIGYEEGRVRVLAGTGLPFLLREGLKRDLTGLEFLVGIPGSVGGALSGNAGAFGRSIGDAVEAAVILEPGGEMKTLSREELDFGYRHSSLRKSARILLEAVLLSFPGDRKGSESLMREYLEKRKEKHPPWGTACAGSYFKNPCSPDGERMAAGYLLEQVKAGGMSVGGAVVYEKHCNFIINRGNAASRDVLLLARELKERVLARFGIKLEEEVIHLPAIV